nr:natterin [Inimicus japonicus]
MMASVFFLLVLLTLSSASLQDGSQHIYGVSIEELAPQHRAVISNRTMQTARLFLSSPMLRQRRQAEPSTLFDGSPCLKWVKWTGSLPDESVAIYNDYEKRFDYVCKRNCDAGFYNPRKGPYCHYPYFNREYRAVQFDILVNKDHFEILEWKDGSYGSVPQHSVKTCSHEDIYVAKNKYGLGKVHVRHKAFFLPWEGSEYYYKSTYQVLTFRKDIYSEQISDVRYNIDRGRILKYPPETALITSVINHECNSVEKTPTVSIKSHTEKRWDFSSSSKLGFITGFSGGVPFMTGTSASLQISSETSFTFSRGKSKKEEISHSMPLKVIVPPNHSCNVQIVAHKYKADMSFTARLTRQYRNKETRSMITSGRYNLVVVQATSVVDRCQPVPNAKPCPQRTP